MGIKTMSQSYEGNFKVIKRKLLEVLIELGISIINLLFFHITLANTAQNKIKTAEYYVELHEKIKKGEQNNNKGE